jgi:hypothetical protein
MAAPTQRQGENLRRLRNCPVCIVCGRPGEAKDIAEALGIAGNILQGHEVAEFDDSRTFYYGSFELANDHLDYLVTSSHRQGIQSFNVSVALLLHILRPRFVVHAGVCAGYRDPEGK